MAYVTLQLEIPKAFGGEENPDAVRREFLSAAVAKWYELGLVSQGRGAEILGLHREDFIQLLCRYGVAAIQCPEEQLDQEFAP